MRYRLAAGLLLVCLIPANICQGAAGKGMLNGDTKIEKRTKAKKGRLKKTPKGRKHRKGVAKVIKVEIASMPIQVAVVKGGDGIKQEVYESWEKEMTENAAKAARRQPFETF